MTRIEETLYCDGCGAEIIAAPVAQNGQIYCCEDCRDGFECHCGDRMEFDDETAGYNARSTEDLPYPV